MSQLDVSYDAVSGSFIQPMGTSWVANSSNVAKYVNKAAPTGGSTKVSVIKPGKLLKHVAKSLGDTPIDISTAPQGNVRVVHTVTNDGETNRHCAELVPFGCAHEIIAAGTGYKLVCRIDRQPVVYRLGERCIHRLIRSAGSDAAGFGWLRMCPS